MVAVVVLSTLHPFELVCGVLKQSGISHFSPSAAAGLAVSSMNRRWASESSVPPLRQASETSTSGAPA